MQPTSLPFELAFNLLPGHPAVRVCETLYAALARIWKTLFAYQFVVMARPR